MADDRTDEHDEIRAQFSEAVNMTASELQKWLDGDESQSVGQESGGSAESTGRESGRRIGEHGYVARHLAQQPMEEAESSRWRYSLMNWGHDPLKKDPLKK